MKYLKTNLTNNMKDDQDLASRGNLKSKNRLQLIAIENNVKARF